MEVVEKLRGFLVQVRGPGWPCQCGQVAGRPQWIYGGRKQPEDTWLTVKQKSFLCA